MKLGLITRGWRGTSQPRAIKSTTRTELHHEGIYITKYIHWNIDTILTALHIRIFVTANGLIGDDGVVYIR